MAMPVGSPRMVDIVGELPQAGGRAPIRVPISSEMREWLLGLWRRTGGDGDMVDVVTSIANTNAATIAGMAARLAYLEDRVRSLEAERAIVAPRPQRADDVTVWGRR